MQVRRRRRGRSSSSSNLIRTMLPGWAKRRWSAVAGLLHKLVDRLHRALGRHHRGGAGLEDLQDMRRVAGPERRDAGVHRVRIRTLIDRNDL